MFFWIDAIVNVIQYGGRTKLCNDVKGKNQTEQLNVFIKIAQASQVYEYGSYYLKN
jgi:hypothetical protein